MKKLALNILIMSSLLLSASQLYAQALIPIQQPPLNRISLQLQAEQWVKTNSAKVTVAVNAVLNQTGVVNVHQAVLQKLQKVARSSAWHITQFERNQDKSGLEQIQIKAQVRLSDTNLANLRKQAKVVSKPGMTFKVTDIRYTPSLAEIETVRSALRAKIYAQAKAELDAVNKLYSQQQYFMHDINFIHSLAPQPRNQQLYAMRYKATMPAPQAFSVSDKIVEQAVVVLASKPR